MSPFFNDMEIQKKDDYRRLVVQENTIFMYAPIGEEVIWDIQDNEYVTCRVGITDSDFLAAMNQLEQEGATEINIRINSNGGSTKHGAAIMARMRNAKAEIHTYNDGTCASMAAAIWACGTKRHMATNALLMLHHPSDMCWGNAQEMRDCAAVLDKITESMVLGLAEAMAKKPEEVQALYFAEYKDIFLSYTDVKQQGLIDGDTYDSGVSIDSTAVAAAVRDPFAEYRKRPEMSAQMAVPDTKRNEGLLNQIAKMISGMWTGEKTATALIHSPLTDTNMSKEELANALTEGKLTPADVQSILDEATKPDPQAALLNEIKALRKDFADQKTELDTVKSELTKIGGQPGEGRSTPGKPDGDTPDPVAGSVNDAKAKLDKMNAEINAAIEGDQMVKFS